MKKFLWILLFPLVVFADDIRERTASPSSVIEDSICVPELDGQTCLHVDEDHANLVIEVLAEDGTQIALYDAGTELEDIATIGTYAAPSGSNVRVSPQGGVTPDGPDLTQIMFADSVYSGESLITFCISDGGVLIMDFCRTIQMFMPNDWITAATIASNAITSNEIANSTITANKIATDAITAQKIAQNAITANDIAADAIGASEIATDAIGALEIATAAIGADELATDAITSAELATNAAQEIRDSILAATIDGSIDLQCAIALSFAYNAGKWTQAGSVVTYRNPGDSANRIVGTIGATSFDSITRTCP